jgi:hypothetical protein
MSTLLGNVERDIWRGYAALEVHIINSIWKKWKSFSVDEDLRKKTIAKYSGK